MTRYLLALAIVAFLTAFTAANDAKHNPQTLADQIDHRINASLRAHKIDPAGLASDAEYLCRVTLDILGRIPIVAEARAFLEEKITDKRKKLVERLLASPTAINHAATVWRASLIPQSVVNPRVQYLNVSLEAWLRDRLRAGRKADELVRDLLTTPLDYLDHDSNNKPRPVPGPTAVAFYQANDLKPETVASSAARILLGIKIECAQCHNHPFDKWTQQQFWETAAFFASVPPRDPEEKFRPLDELLRRKTVKINDTMALAGPKFIDGNDPDWKVEADPRKAFAEWVTAKSNPFFARTITNRIWAQFFGVGLVDPGDDFGPHNPPSHPELLNDLVEAFTSSGFDCSYLIRAITRTTTYQRSSKALENSQSAPRQFARMNVKG
jgi:hypothetical protein